MTAIQQRTGAVRRFNRFYTRQMRVLYEIAHGSEPTASDIGRALDLDAGYLSRVLRNFEKRGLITRKSSAEDARQSHLALTARGRKTFAPAERGSQRDVSAMLGKLNPIEQTQLIAAMQTIENLLCAEPANDAA